jgi:hypothetical protein
MRWRTGLRKALAALLAVAYVLTVVSFWVFGALAYFINLSGAWRLAGLLLLPILALPIVGRGEVAFIQVDSDVWWWWSALSFVLAAAMLATWPSRSDARTDDSKLATDRS